MIWIFFLSFAFALEEVDFCQGLSEEKCKKEKFCKPRYRFTRFKNYGSVNNIKETFWQCEAIDKKKKQKNFKIESH